MKKAFVFQSWLIAYALLLAAPTKAEDTASFALVVGSNRPGEGQEALSFANEDADRFGAVLRELSGFLAPNIQSLRDPSVVELDHALREMTARVADRAKAGEKTSFVFYYSGHARATALNVGHEELSLKALRALLDAVPASFKLIVLDACQTGAISKVKGVVPAADFSYNSVTGLSAEGMAVIASSAASELAQESDHLQGSFFTHHLVAALRGAADANLDGLVTLDEAYRYTYNRTLMDTSKTAVGKQHVTLETALLGAGETVLSRPRGAKARLAIERGIGGEVLIFRQSDKQLMAEIHKAAGDSVALALPPAAYVAVIRTADKGYECDARLMAGGEKTVALQSCQRVRLAALPVKGAGYRRNEHLFFEVGLGAQLGRTDGYNNRLHDFGYRGDIEGGPILQLGASAYYSILRYLKVGLQFSFLDKDEYWAEDESFSWKAYRVGVTVRGALPLAHDWLTLYLQASGGLAFAVTHYTNDGPALLAGDENGPSVSDEERFFGYHVGGGGGVQLTPWQYAGFFWQAEGVYAPVIENLIGDTHDSGGVLLITGVLGGF